MNRNNRGSLRKACLSLTALLAGGATFTSCDSRVKQAVVNGLESTVYLLLDPSFYIDEEALDDANSIFD